MALWRSVVVLGLALVGAVPALGQTPDLKAIARTLVNESAGIQQGEAVLITGSARDQELLENLAIEVSKVGGEPLIALFSERLERRSYDEVPAKYDTNPPKVGLGLVQIFNAWISLDVGESEAPFAGVPPERIAARSKAGAPLGEAMAKRGLRLVNLGNGLYPTAALAKGLNTSESELVRSFWSGVGTSPKVIKAAGDRCQAIFSAGKRVTLTAPNGTSLSFGIVDRPAIISDGSLVGRSTPQGTQPATWLPAGEFIITPEPGTAEGKIVFERILWNGKEVSKLSLSFSGGRLTAMDAANGLEALKTSYEAGGAGKDEFAFLDIGLNPNVKLPTTTGRVVWMASGAVTVGVGNNLLYGGANNSDFSFAGQLGSATVKVDDKAVVEAGTVK
jgi:leucyl aminopeptidase (aminopeptidase T)